ncbi:hypothetical protein CENSYa_0714 [Cenarchaeum symbiosum A]|uniref:Uncharacterized protein n=1 Tax=Cenarchaeum symbiosum (strain A) TaxID=414004 RepID=A0RVI0_CENSY|nr:hypothetical protein CENSYa_0714 [Cenarchaeum symbiosum A]
MAQFTDEQLDDICEGLSCIFGEKVSLLRAGLGTAFTTENGGMIAELSGKKVVTTAGKAMYFKYNMLKKISGELHSTRILDHGSFMYRWFTYADKACGLVRRGEGHMPDCLAYNGMPVNANPRTARRLGLPLRTLRGWSTLGFAGADGMVWFRVRSSSVAHILNDTSRRVHEHRVQNSLYTPEQLALYQHAEFVRRMRADEAPAAPARARRVHTADPAHDELASKERRIREIDAQIAELKSAEGPDAPSEYVVYEDKGEYSLPHMTVHTPNPGLFLEQCSLAESEYAEAYPALAERHRTESARRSELISELKAERDSL